MTRAWLFRISGPAIGLCFAAPAAADIVKNPTSYELSTATPERQIYVGATGRPATIQFANVALTFPPTVGSIQLYKRIPATSNNGGWVGQVMMSAAPVRAITDRHYAYCEISGAQTVSFSIRIGQGPTSTTKVAVKNGIAISPPFTFAEKEPTTITLLSADPVQPPLESAIKQTWYFRKCTIGGSLF